MPLSRRSFSFYVKKRDNDGANKIKEIKPPEVPNKPELSTKKVPNIDNGSSKDDLVYRTPKLSRKNSVSLQLIDELKNNTLYKEQKQKIERRKTRSSEYLFDAPRQLIYLNFNKDKESRKKPLTTSHKRKSSSLSDLYPKPGITPEVSATEFDLDIGNFQKYMNLQAW